MPEKNIVPRLSAGLFDVTTRVEDLEQSADVTSSWFPILPQVVLGKAYGGGLPDFSFGVSVNGSVATVISGNVRMHDVGNYTVSGGDVALSGTIMWVYVSFDRETHVGTLECVASEPVSDSATIRLPLVYVEGSSEAGFSVVKICHVGDFNFTSPLR